MKFFSLIAAIASVSALQIDGLYACTWTQTLERNTYLTPSKVALGTCKGDHCTHGCTDCPESAC